MTSAHAFEKFKKEKSKSEQDESKPVKFSQQPKFQSVQLKRLNTNTNKLSKTNKIHPTPYIVTRRRFTV